MVKKIINIGIEGNDATGDPIRDAFEKTNENFNEIYSLFGKGDGIGFADLTDYDPNRNGELVSESIFIVNNSGDPNIPGSKILAKKLVGDNIEIINTDPDKITIKNTGSRLSGDAAPRLSAPLNADGYLIYNLKDATAADSAGLGIELAVFAATQGYVGSNFVGLDGDAMRGPLTVPAGATGNQVPRRNEVVGLAGDTMTGPLKLSRNPVPADDTDYNGLIAATKQYVDTTSFSSQVNLFVSAASGNDFRFDVPESKRGSALAYAFKTVNRACFKAEQLINAAAIELGPYQKPIFYNNGNNISQAISVTGPKEDLITFTLTITNAGGQFGTDMRGNSLTSAAGVDIRAGLVIRGTTSGALGMITLIDTTIGAGGTTNGVSYSGSEKYEFIYKNFIDVAKTQPVEFIPGETLEYADSIQKLNITIFLESGEYYENYPIRVPANVTIVGDDTRRVIIKPKTGPSGSIWSDLYFRRDITIDGLTVVTPVTAGNFVVGQRYTIASLGTTTNNQWKAIAGTTGQTITYSVGSPFTANTIGASSGTGTAYCVFGYHYLKNPSKKLYNNPDNLIDTTSSLRYANAQFILNANRTFLQNEIIAYVTATYPGSYSQSQQDLCYRDVGSIIDAIGFDLTYGNYSRTLEAAMSYYTNASALKTITGDQLAKTIAMIIRLESIVKSAIQKQLITKTTGNTSVQNTTFTITSEAGAGDVVASLMRLLKDIIEKNETVVNFPKDNNLLDVFLLNDTTRLRTISAQGHGGFMVVLDPAGQILTKSPYVFQCSSFTRSTNKQQFAGGLFVDAFTGNLSCKVVNNSYSVSTKVTTLRVSGLVFRTPANIPVSFVISGKRFEVDWIDQSNGYGIGEYNLYLNSNTPDNEIYTGVISPVTQLLPPNLVIELETAGNRSMLCSDFTQINDLGYGICASNGSYIEAVSIFTYYCYRGFYSLNGSQIRSLNGSCAFGTYALSSEGSDPTEIATTASLRYPTIQILTTYSAGDFSLKNLKSDLIVFVRVSKNRSSNYIPFTSSELEIRHSDLLTGRYYVSNSSPATVIVGGSLINLSIDNDDIYQLSLSSSGNSNTLTTGLVADVPDATPVIVRVLKNFAVVQLTNANPTRPSTALQFNNDSNIYHLSAYTETPITIIATSAGSNNTINVTPGSTVGLIAGQEIKFTRGVSFSTNILLNTTYYINTITPNSFKLSSSKANATLATPVSIVVSASPTNVTIQPTLITGNFEITTSAFTEAYLKGSSILINATGISGIFPGNTYYLAASVNINGTLIKLSASYDDAMSASPTVIQISGTPSGLDATRKITLGQYLEGTVGSAKDLSSQLTIESNYDYVTLSPKSGAQYATQINIEKLSVTNQARIVGMIFAWNTVIHKITSYLPAGTGTGKSGSTDYDTILFTNQLTKAVAPSSYANVIQTLKAGLNNLTSANAQVGLTLNSEISVMRASGHDLVDIGTGGYANSNIPTNIYGVSAIPKSQDNEVQEIGRGRVFYSTTDQDGNFKVGKYFQVDQGTGSVTFSASLSITGIDGLGFSRGGVTVKEFATDETMGQRSSDTVPTQSAVVGYIDRRLGLVYSSAGSSISSQKLGPGFIALDGTTTFGTSTNDRLDMGTHKIINLKAPESESDATNKLYVDSFFKRAGSIRSGIDGFEMSDKTTFNIESVARNAQGIATIVLKDSVLRSGQHGLSVGSLVTISGANDPNTGFNSPSGQFWTVSEIVSATSFRFVNTGYTTVIGTNTPISSATVTTESNISMNGAKITNLLAPTDGSDAVNKTYVDAAVASKDQLSELNDVSVSSILDGQPLSYNTATSKWVNNRPVDQSKLSLRLAKTIGSKPSGLSVAAGNFQIGKTYIITSLGTPTETTQLQWNTIAGTTGQTITYSIGSIFTAAATGANSGNGTATEDIQANSGVASFNSTHFTIATDSNGFVSLADGGITLAKLDKIGTGYVIGNNSGADATPALVTFANALNSAITIPQGQTVAPAGVIAKASDATFSTILYSTISTNNALVQRNETGGITVGAVSAGAITGSSLNVSTGNITGGSITSSGIISAKTELQIDTKKLFSINGNATELYNRVGLKVADFTGSLAPDTITGQLYGDWTIKSITTGGAATAGTLTGNWSVSTVTTNALTTGAAATAGTITGNWSLSSGSQLRATYADLAEYYSSDNDYSPGTVVMIGGDQDVTLAKGYGNTAVAGVVSENPAYLMNSECSGIRVAIALQGRVLCKVVGSIKKGDRLVVSQVAGAAATSKDPKPGSIIGKALANYDSDRIGMIEVLVGKH